MNAPARLRTVALLAVAIAAAGVAACGPRTPTRPCPPVLVPRDAGALIKFRPGPGRDPTDVLYEVRIANFVGTCSFARSGAATVDIKVFIDVRRGPAETTGRAEFAYFAAIPRYFPAPAGKQTFPVRVAFTDAPGRLVAQEEVRLVLPLRPDERTDEYEIFLALQLTPEEIEFNNGHRQ